MLLIIFSNTSFCYSQKPISNFDASLPSFDSIAIYKTILNDSAKFIYKKSRAIRNLEKFGSQFKNNYYIEYYYPFNTRENTIFYLFDDSDSIVIDSSYLAHLIENYRYFYLTMSKSSKKYLLRPDVSYENLKSEVDLTIFKYNATESIDNSIDQFSSDFRHYYTEKDSVEIKKRLSDIKYEIFDYKNSIPLNHQTLDFYTYCDSIIHRLNTLNLKVTSTNTPYKISENIDAIVNSDSYSFEVLVNYERQARFCEEVRDKLDNGFNRSNYQDFVLSILLSVDCRINYNPLFLNEKIDVFENWLHDMDISSITSLTFVKLNPEAKFVFGLNVISNQSSKILKFLCNYDSLPFIDQSRLDELFMEKFYFKISNIFRIPLESFMVIKNPFARLHTEYVYNQGQLTSYEETGLPYKTPCPGCLMKDSVHITKLEYTLNSSRIADYIKNKNDGVQDVLYNALLKYFEEKQIPREKVKRISVEYWKITVFAGNIRKIILENEIYWENVQISAKLLVKNKNATLQLIVDGEYATGAVIGDFGKPPSYKAYKPMEPKYSNQLKIYTSDLMYQIKDYLIGKNSSYEF